MADAAVEEKQDQQSDEAQADSKTQAQSVEFPEAPADAGTGGGGSLDILLDIDIPVTVAIGKKMMTVRKLLQLGPGSVLNLDKPLDVPADLYLKDTKFATGDIVVVDGQFAVRLRNIIGLGNSDATANAE